MKRVRINTAAIYTARSHRIRAALAADRSEFCEQGCYAARGGHPSLCDDGGCWARSVAARSPILCSPAAIYGQRRLEVERSRSPAPRPRTIADAARRHYATKENAR